MAAAPYMSRGVQLSDARINSETKYKTSGMKRTLPASPQTSKNTATSPSCFRNSEPLVWTTPASVSATVGVTSAFCSSTCVALHLCNFSLQARLPSSNSACKSPKASTRRSFSSTSSPRCTARSATVAQCERQRDNKCSNWLRTLSVWKSNTTCKEAKTSADKFAKSSAAGKTRKQFVCNHRCCNSLYKLLVSVSPKSSSSAIIGSSSSGFRSALAGRTRHDATATPKNMTTANKRSPPTANVDRDPFMAKQ
mmetsp:Transcript_10440/g.36649  ORF Transcript_10440/g.36649 Transcript_10440/m.36649 type:complete len:252 (+) Transcript_10440:1482-2237(+)